MRLVGLQFVNFPKVDKFVLAKMCLLSYYGHDVVWVICNPDSEIKFVNPGRVDKLQDILRSVTPVI